MSIVKIDFPPNSKKSIFVTWTLHNFCNYRCSYCPPGCHASTKRPYGPNEVISFVEQTVKQAQKSGYENYTIAFSGGEPTLFPEFDRIIKTLYSQGIDVTFTSNASRSIEYWKSIANDFNHCVWSFHPEQVIAEEFLEKAKFVSKHCWLNIDFMMTQNHFSQNIELGKELEKLENVRVDYLPIQKEFGGLSEGLINYSPEQLDFLQNRKIIFKEMTGLVSEKLNKFKIFGRGPKTVIRNIDGHELSSTLNYKELIAKDENQFFGWECFAGIESLIVNMDGSVYRAYCYQDGKLGNIWDEFVIPEKSVICNKERCKCSVDIEVSKKKVVL